MVVRITLIVSVAIIGLLIAGVWLLRRSISRDECPAMKLRCPACGKPAPGGASFCGHCGAGLGTGRDRLN